MHVMMGVDRVCLHLEFRRVGYLSWMCAVFSSISFRAAVFGHYISSCLGFGYAYGIALGFIFADLDIEDRSLRTCVRAFTR